MYIYHAFINALSAHMIHVPAKERSMHVMLKAEVFFFFTMYVMQLGHKRSTLVQETPLILLIGCTVLVYGLITR